MPSRGNIVVAGTIALGIAAVVTSLLLFLPHDAKVLPRDEKEVYFHRGSGQLVVRGGRAETIKLLDPHGPVYGVTYLPSSSTLALNLDFGIAGNGGLSFSIENFAGAGQYPVAQTAGEVRDAMLSLGGGEAYRCYSRCRTCTVTVDTASRASISGSVACSSMINCAASRLDREIPVIGNEPCRQPAPSTIDVAGTFLLDDSTDKRRDR